MLGFNRFNIVIISSLFLVACGGGGGGGTPQTGSGGSGGGTTTPPPKTVIKFDSDDSTYRVPEAGDQIAYDLDVTYREYDVFGLLAESNELTTLDLDFFTPASNISGNIKNIQDSAVELGYTPLKVVRTLASGNDSVSSVQGFKPDFVTELYDDEGFFYEDIDGQSYLLISLPPLVEGQSFEQQYYQLPNNYVTGNDYWEGSREFNVGGVEEIETAVDEIEALKITYTDIAVQYAPSGLGGRLLLQARGTTGTVWIHPKIGIVKATLTYREDTDALVIEEIFEDAYIEQDAIWVLRSVNFTTPAPE